MSNLPAKDRDYLESKGIDYEEHAENTQQAVIIRNCSLPNGRFDVQQADVLILLPPGYPDVPPDMFYLLPWVRLLNGGRYPSRADVAFNFKNQSWQRWSRHNNEWRPGADGIWTMLKRVKFALEKAA